MIGTVVVSGCTQSNTIAMFKEPRLYLCSPGNDTITVYNYVTNEPVKGIQLTTDINGLLVSSDGNRLYAVNGQYLSIVDTRTGQIIDNIYISPSPWGYLAANGTCLFIRSDRYQISIMRLADDRIIGTINDTPDGWGMQASQDGKRLYMCDFYSPNLYTINLTGQNSVQKTPIGEGVCGEMAVTPGGQLLYLTKWSSNELDIIDAAQMTVSKTITLARGSSSGIVVTNNGGTVYFSDYDGNRIIALSTANDDLLKTYNVTKPRSLAISPDNQYLCVVCEGGPVEIINLKNDITTILPIVAPTYGNTIAFNPAA